jgi:hypothetical protein
MGSTTTGAIGNGPFEFTDANGKHWSIPLYAFQFAGNSISVDSAWSSLANSPSAQAFLQYAATNGIIVPAPAPSLFPAMVIQAADPGAAGNNITVAVKISHVISSPPTNDPTLTQFSLTVTETDTYPALTVATVQSVLDGQGGLVRVAQGSVYTADSPNKQSGSFASSADYPVLGGGSPSVVFILVPKKNGSDATTTISITPNVSNSSGQETFQLVATWTKTVSGITLGTLESLVAANLSYLITVSKPGGGAYSVPADNTTTQLSGGGPGINASANLFTGL